MAHASLDAGTMPAAAVSPLQILLIHFTGQVLAVAASAETRFKRTFAENRHIIGNSSRWNGRCKDA